MRFRPPARLAFALVAAVTFAFGPIVGPAAAQNDADGSVSIELNQRELTFHILNRLAFGPKPGQVEEVLKKGWMNWVLQQLEPEKIDDSRLDKILKDRFPSLYMSMSQALAEYRPQYRNKPPTRAEQIQRNRLRAKIRRELTQSVLVRAVYSERQLNEVLVEFWRNHFSIDHQKDQCQYLANHYEQNVIRKHVLGRFEDMLMASAKHPAMLIYLDNARSQRPLSEKEKEDMVKLKAKAAKGGRKAKRAQGELRKLTRQRGLNENYARELFELHTLGVDRYYTQRDVVECARALTGWSVTYGQNANFGFTFRANVHDDGPKRVLGWRFSGKEGVQAGETIIKRLASHPGTAEFISFKLCRYLVNDRPSEELVERVAKTFRETKGDLKKVYMAIIFSPEFRSRLNYRCKFKTPFEFTVSAIRAVQGQIRNPVGTERMLTKMGQPIYKMDDPTGYYDQAEAWLDPGVLVHRWNFALQLAASRLPGVRMPQSMYTPLLELEPEGIKKQLVKDMLPGALDPNTSKVIDEVIGSTPYSGRRGNAKLPVATKMLGIILGSPNFQQQ